MWGVTGGMAERRGFKGHVFGRLIVTWCRNGEGAPLLDDCYVTDAEGRRYTGKALSLVRKRNRYGERLRGPALVVGWRVGGDGR